MLNKILSLSKRLIAIKSIFSNPQALEQSLDITLSNLTEFTIERFSKNGVKSALAYNSKKRPKKFKIILNGHLDVIPGKDYQYFPKIIKDRLYGVGAMDMKTNVACLVTVFKSLAHKVKYPLALQLVTDEEMGGLDGTKFQVDNGVRADFVITGETTNFKIVNQAKGVLWVEISTKGKAAHGAYPWKGNNAIWKMNKFLTFLAEKYAVPERENQLSTVNLSKIQTSNESFNKIPDDCKISLDIRYIPKDSDKIIIDIKKILPRGFKMNIIQKEPSLIVNKNNRYIRLLKKITEDITSKKVILYQANGTSDARHYTQVSCAGIEFGPIGGGIGSDNEWIDIPSLKKYVNILRNFLLSI